MTQPSFASECKRWRHHRRLSQLELALNAEVSQRHLSYLETGRSQPSRDMIQRLSDALALPLRAKNTLMSLAGYTAVYPQRTLDAPQMAPVMEALNHVLTYHNPLPALVIDRQWSVLKSNAAMQQMMQWLFDESALEQFYFKGQLNLARLCLHPDGLIQHLHNWPEASAMLVRRLRREAAESNDPGLSDEFEQHLSLLTEPVGTFADKEQVTPVVPLKIRLPGTTSNQVLSLFSVISSFGTAQDVTADELRLETFYSMDAATQAFFTSLSTPQTAMP